jgi:hypothetical protein
MSKSSLIHDLFTSAADQLARVRRLNADRGWGFTDGDFECLDPAPAWPLSNQDRLVAVVLEVVLASPTGQADILHTVDELWELAAEQQEHFWRYEELKSDPKHLAFFDGIKAKPGLRWVVIDLGANRGTAPASVRSPNSPHVAILMAAMLHPEWVRAMDGENVPFVWIAGLKANVPWRGEWNSVPYLYFCKSEREVYFRTDRSDRRELLYAIPAFRA